MKKATTRIVEHLIKTNRITLADGLEVAPAIDKIIEQEGLGSRALSLFDGPDTSREPQLEEKAPEAGSQAREKRGQKKVRRHKSKKAVYPIGRLNVMLGSLVAWGHKSVSREKLLKRCRRVGLHNSEHLVDEFVSAGRLKRELGGIYEIVDLDTLIFERHDKGTTDAERLARACLCSTSRVRDALAKRSVRAAMSTGTD